MTNDGPNRVKISADSQTRDAFNLRETEVSEEQARRLLEKVNPTKEFVARREGPVLTIKRFIRD